MKNKKIILVSDSFPPVPSGVSKYSYFLTKKLLEKGNRVFVITGGVKNIPYEDYEIQKMGGEVIRFGKLISVYANGTRCFITIVGLRDIIKLKRTFETIQPDVVLMNGPLGLTLPYPATIFSKSKMVGIFHSSTDKPNLGFILFRQIMKPFLKKLDVKIAVSERAKDEIEKYFGKQDFFIIPPGVDTELYKPSKGRKSDENITFFFLGRLDKRKGVDVLLKSWENVRKFGNKKNREVPLNLVIGGDGPMRSLVQAEAKKQKNIKYIGFVEEKILPEIYASADVSVFPSKGGESFGIVLIESMACGTPPIASNIGGYKDVVKDKYVGLLFSSEKELIQKINEISANEKMREQLSKNAIEYAKVYDWKTIAEKIMNVI